MEAYALIFSDGMIFSWHPSYADALSRQRFEARTFDRDLKIVPANSVDWEHWQRLIREGHGAGR